MNRKQTRRLVAILLIWTLALSLSACTVSPASNTTGGEAPTSTEITATTDTMETDPPIDTAEIGEWENMMEQAEMIDVVSAWAGFSSQGVLDSPDSYQTVEIKSKSDLDPYRQYLPKLTQEEENAFLADEKGYCILIEITTRSERHYYDVSSIFNTGNAIEILVSEFEEEDPEVGDQPAHTFFLFYFSSEVYHDETVKVLFFNT